MNDDAPPLLLCSTVPPAPVLKFALRAAHCPAQCGARKETALPLLLCSAVPPV